MPGRPDTATPGANPGTEGMDTAAPTSAPIVALADAAVDAIVAAPRDYAAHGRILYDLRFSIVELAARANPDPLWAAPLWSDPLSPDQLPQAPLPPDAPKDVAVPAATPQAGALPAHAESDELLWNLARVLPGFSTEALYQKRASLAAMAGMTLLGWLAGGAASTVLGWFGLGGDILRVAGVFAMFWLSEYLAATPRARHILLAALGLGALGRFAAGILSGMLRLGSWAGIRQAIFGAGRLPNIFKTVWLLFGALVVAVFLAKKITALDSAAFRRSLRTQAEERLAVADFALAEIARRDAALDRYAETAEGGNDADGPCPRTGCALAREVLGLLDTFDDNTRHFLAQRLAEAGYAPQLPGGEGEAAGWLVWEPERDAALYDVVGLVQAGDRCRILRHAVRTPGGTVRGLVQRAPGSAGNAASGARP